MNIIIQQCELGNLSQLRDEALVCSSRLKSIRSNNNLGVKANQELEISLNEIRVAIINFKNELTKPKVYGEADNDQKIILQDNLKVVFFDDFSRGQSWLESNKWNVGDSFDDKEYSGKIEYANNRLFIFHKLDKGTASLKKVNINEYNEFSIEMKATLIWDNEECWYGLQWGRSNNNNFYYFVINEKKKLLTIRYYFEGEKHIILNDKKVAEISSENILKIHKHKGSMSFYINDTLVHTSKIYAVFGSYLGFVVYDYGRAACEYIRVRN